MYIAVTVLHVCIYMYMYVLLLCCFQAAYRGYWIRCRLCKVVQGAQYVSEEENSLEDDFELNLTDDVSMHICLLEFISFRAKVSNSTG